MYNNNLKSKLLEEINKLPKDSFESVYQIIHYFRIELSKNRKTSKKSFSKKFLQTFGSWQDSRSAEQIAEEIYSSRCFIQKNLQW
ncbi:MAG: hypothetical protein A2Z59_12840 [Nitrospinae bacterium RIFCSPLOWO2_02_39_17]|nr:MAG: hypothetical protein A3D97_02075 [Nitrospinae bacterium RIFCSPHIGHO2_12_FULL_39_42]OGW03216.1 MAG: hypothetical protein A2Z59_12840 [Nitrospinae bacterium RIFCSPLOWO2_02_39_17]OGW07678.1 MAG: hypothetical protein A2W75_10685 [Nitrospinae bacterium RIFCSPLOWO2_12_39_15]